MKVDIKTIKKDIFNNDSLYCIGNLPYYLSTDIIYKVLTSMIFENCFFLLQQEYVDSFMNEKKKSKWFFIFRIFSNIEIIKSFDRYKFYPTPKVNSCLVKFTCKKNTVNERDKVIDFIKLIFKYKRKTLSNNLKNANYNLKNTKLYNFLLSNNYLNRRSETLSIEDIIIIYNQLNTNGK